MPPPPPPPGAPPPPALPSASSGSKGATKTDRKDLLKDIQLGKRLKPTQTNDRSSPIIGTTKNNNSGSSTSSPSQSANVGRVDGSSSQNVGGPLPGIGGLFSAGMPTLKKTKGGIQTGRNTDPDTRFGIPPTNMNKHFNSSTSSSLNSSPSLSPSPSPVGSTPTHTTTHSKAPPPPPSNKPSVPSAKPNINPRPSSNSPGPVHPSSKPPPPPPNGKLAPPTNLTRSAAISKSFNQTIGHGPQGRPQLPKYTNRASKDDTSIRNGEIGTAPPPPVRTVSQTQINTGGRVPSRAPPPPPPSHKRPSQPPPPPPSQSAPPPSAPGPTLLQPPDKALPPPPSHSHSTVVGDPPTPPTRRESIHSRTAPNPSSVNAAAASNSSGDSFESRFASRFRTIQYLPPPEPFSGCQKTYPSKNTLPVRQGSQIKRTPAPPPPPGKAAPPSAPPPPPYLGDVSAVAPGKPPLPPLRQWPTTTSGML